MEIYFRKHFIAFTALAAVIAAVLLGCAQSVRVNFTAERIYMQVGQSRDLTPYLTFIPFDGTDKSVTFTSNDDCVRIDGTTVIAVKSGAATVTANSNGGSAQISVEVTARENNDLTLYCNNAEQCLSTDKASPVMLSAEISEYATETTIAWTVEGEDFGTGDHITFTPSRAGEYTVTATADSVSASYVVRVYHATEAEGTSRGEKNQADGNYTPIEFSVTEKISTLNPRSVYRWYVNGAPYSTSANFNFTPRAVGEYTVTLKVNGVARKIDGSDSVVVTAGGVRAPLGKIVFDGNGVRAVWSDGGYIVRASIFTPEGKRIDLDCGDAQHAYRFGAGTLDLTDVVQVCAEERGTYTIELVADGKRTFTFTQLPQSAREHIDNKVFISNSVVTDEQDCYNIVRDVYLKGKSSYNFFLNTDLETTKEYIESAARVFGLTAEVGVFDDIATVKLSDYVNAPTEYTSVAQATRMFATVPHIEYTRTNRRPTAYVLACDRKRGGIDVTTSEQLLYTVLAGEKPLPAKDTTAQKIYSTARSILLSIIGVDYTDEDKAHAVYDWLQWSVTLASGVKSNSCARFLEGVFGSADIEGRGIGVTDEGLAKAFSLMLGMEGINTPIVLGLNGRYYNRIMLNGTWYNVDVYGGKVGSSELGIGRNSELCSHRGLFVTDAQLAALGVTPDKTVAVTDGSRSPYLRKIKAFGNYFDNVISSSELSQTDVDNIVFDAFNNCVRGSVEVVRAGSFEKYTVLSFGTEIRMDIDKKDYDKVTELLMTAVKRYASEVLKFTLGEGGASIYIVDNVFHVVMTAPL